MTFRPPDISGGLFLLNIGGNYGEEKDQIYLPVLRL